MTEVVSKNSSSIFLYKLLTVYLLVFNVVVDFISPMILIRDPEEVKRINGEDAFQVKQR